MGEWRKWGRGRSGETVERGKGEKARDQRRWTEIGWSYNSCSPAIRTVNGVVSGRGTNGP